MGRPLWTVCRKHLEIHASGSECPECGELRQEDRYRTDKPAGLLATVVLVLLGGFLCGLAAMIAWRLPLTAWWLR